MGCTLKFRGCMTEGALNYQSHATVDDGSCYMPVLGCLNVLAYNFNCTTPGVMTDGTNSNKEKLGCEVHACAQPAPGCTVYANKGVTVHDEKRCTMAYPPPPAPPATNAAEVHTILIEVALATPCSDFTENDLTLLTNILNLATALSWTSSYVCGSVVITSIVSGLSSVQRDSATATLD